MEQLSAVSYRPSAKSKSAREIGQANEFEPECLIRAATATADAAANSVFRCENRIADDISCDGFSIHW